MRISEDFDGGDDDDDDFRSQCVAIYCNSLAIISSVCNLEKAAWYKMISAAMEISNEKKLPTKRWLPGQNDCSDKKNKNPGQNEKKVAQATKKVVLSSLL